MFTTKTGRTIRLRTTIVIESESQAELEEALNQAAGLAKARVMHMAFRASKKSRAAYVSVRTTQSRKRQPAPSALRSGSESHESGNDRS